MATPYKSNGVDFDDIFEPIGTATKADDVGYAINGVDLSNRYYPLSLGGTAPSNVGYATNGTDLSQKFAASGSVVYWVSPEFWDGKTYGAIGNIGDTAGVTLTVYNDGTVLFQRTDPTSEAYEQGNPIPSNVPANSVEVRCSQTGGNGALSNDWKTPQNTFDWIQLDGTGTIAGRVVYKLSVEADHIGTFVLEFREIANVSEGTTGTFSLRVTIMDPGP